MGEAIAIGGLAAVMLLSLPLALGLEWLCLRGAFLLLPASSRGALANTGRVRSTPPGASSPRSHARLRQVVRARGCTGAGEDTSAIGWT